MSRERERERGCPDYEALEDSPDHDPAVGFEKVASHIVNVTAAGLTFIEDALPKGVGLQACVPASLRFTYAPYLWARAHL